MKRGLMVLKIVRSCRKVSQWLIRATICQGSTRKATHAVVVVWEKEVYGGGGGGGVIWREER
jgi:hypothetical protein